MNKTVTINISGIIFHIEEDAYQTLSKYLLTIKGYFSKADGGNEIMSDIEARIAEMLQSKTSVIKQVVLMSDVDFVMESMGKPEEFGNDATDSNSTDKTSDAAENIFSNEDTKKRIYRDSDSKIIGGVCSGVAHYFGFDPVWLRIALACLFFFGGTGVLLYIILWIAIPEAKTTAEKLAMKGEKADINNISRAVKEEAEHLKKRMEKYGEEFKNMAHNNKNVPRNAAEKIIDFIADILLNIGRVLLKILGILMVIFGIIFFLGLFSSVFGMSIMTSNVEVKDWIDTLLLDGKDFYLGIIGIAIFVGTPIIMMIYGGVKILFKVNYTNRWINLSAGIIWLFGFLLLLYIGLRTGSDFNKEAKVRENVSVKQYDTLYLKMSEMPINFEEVENVDEVDEDDKEFNVKKVHNDYMIGKHYGVKYLLGHAQLNIIKSQSNIIELVIVKESKGGDKKSATDRAKNIIYTISQTDSVIKCDNIFKVNNADKFRVQTVKVILKVPAGKVVYLDKTLELMLNDLDNITNTYDGDMVNRRWIMTEKGLKCLDCNGLDVSTNDEDKDDEKQDINITVDGVDLKDKNASINIDKNGIHIRDKKENTKLNKKETNKESEKQSN